MNKIEQFRQRVADAYHNFELEDAARHGEALLREHWNNRSMLTLGYANDIYNLARVYDELGSFERAIELYTDGAHLYSRLSKGDPTGYTNCLNNLAAVMHEMGMEDNSVHLFGQLVGVKRFYGQDSDIDFADSLYNFANALTDARHADQRRKWHNEALKLRDKGGNAEDCVDSLHSLAFIYEERKDYEKAVVLAQKAVEIAQGDDYISAVHYLATLYDAWGRYDAALPLYKEAMALTRARVGRNHHSYLEAAADHADMLGKTGRVREALALQNEIRVLLEGMGDVGCNAYAECLRAAAELHKQLGEYDKAEALLLRSMRLMRHRKVDLTADIVHLIRLFLHMENNERAMEVLVYALMNSESGGPGLAQLLTHLAVAFNPSAQPTPDALLDALRTMNNPEKLAPIMKKWSAWENELFIPAFVMPPPAGPDRT